MKGFCTETGFPITLPWMATFEPQILVERFNAIMRGFANFYLPVIRNRSKIHRWIYILRFSFLKILAQKYKKSISKIFKKYGTDLFSTQTKTIKFTVEQKYGDKIFFKSWKLLTYYDLVNNKNHLERRKYMLKTFWDIEKGRFTSYPSKTGFPSVTNENYLEAISWVSWRTQANMDMPCAYCGSFNNVQMHHIKHIRKRSYVLIPESQNYKKILALRNRKQIPLCEQHHMNLIHNGTYSDTKLIKLAPNSNNLIDNRIISMESFIKPGIEYTAKSLLEKGWKEKNK